MTPEKDCKPGGTPSAPARRWKLPVVYEKEQVDLFWGMTDDKTRNEVKNSAELEGEKQTRKILRRRLSKADKQYLTSCSASDLETLLSKYLGQANQQQESYNADNGGLKLARREISKFMNNFHGYLQAYSGVIEIMNGAGQGYGDAAYGALSLLLVAVHKQKTEDIINTALLELQKQYSRIQRLKDVYATATMKEHIAVVYRLGIEFAHQAVLYYSVGTFRRFTYLLSQPPSVGLESKVSEIKAAIEEAKTEMDTHDRIRLNNVEMKLGEVDTKVGRTEQNVEALHIKTDIARLETLQQLLQVEARDLEESVGKYEDRLKTTFNGIPKLPPFEDEAEPRLFGSSAFHTWRESNQSSLFALQGKTVAPDRTLLSWISPAATKLVSHPEKYLIDSTSPEHSFVLHYFCQTAEYYDTVPVQRCSCCTVLSNILYQMLKSPHLQPLIRDDKHYSKLKQDIANSRCQPTAKSAQRADRMSELFSLLSRLLDGLSLGKVFIVLDRIDQLQGNAEDFLDPLLNFIHGTKHVMKVFVTMRTAQGYDNSTLAEATSRKGYSKLVYDQE